jgi:hypothetical protein
MIPRSKDDKEYFPQDWFVDRLKTLDLPFEQQGRNSYPDFWVGKAVTDGYEIKSLAFSDGRPARPDFDCNSTIPSGRKQGREVFLAFFLYTGKGASPRPVHTLSIAHADLINSDHTVADAHINPAVHDFGSYGDGFIRNRKMYVFPHPVAIDPTGIARHRLIVPAEWQITDSRLRKVRTIERTVASNAVDGYEIRLHGGEDVKVHKVPYQNAGQIRAYDVFEAA